MSGRWILVPALVALAMMAPARAEGPAGSGARSGQDAASVETPASSFTGTVLETLDAGSNTYVHLDTGKRRIWAAAPHFEAEAGDTIAVPAGIRLVRFHSSIFDRVFDEIYLVRSVRVVRRKQAAPPPPARD